MSFSTVPRFNFFKVQRVCEAVHLSVGNLCNVSSVFWSTNLSGPYYCQRLCFCSSALSKPRPVPDTKRRTKITLIAYTSPRYCRSILLAVVGPFSSLHSKSCLSSPINVTQLFIIQSCGGAFFIAYFLHLHYTEHTLWLALDVGRKCGQPKCVRFRSCHFQALQHFLVFPFLAKGILIC
jgi:hypothetical protein